MSVLTSLARAYAVQRGRAEPIATVRHVHVSRRPLVLVPLTLAGEANAPIAAMVGDDPDDPHVLIVAQPRDRTQRFDFAHRLATILLPHVDRFMGDVETVQSKSGRPPRFRALDAPQVWVPNRGGIEFIRLFGRSTRFRQPAGPHAVPITVPMLGKWLTYLAERSEYRGSSLLVAATEALALHWATGQSPVEDANLAAILGWIDPPAGMTGAAAAAAAEDPVTCPPAGPATDPSFDKVVLAPSIEEYDRSAGDPHAQQGAVAKLEAALRSQMEPTWHLMWRAIGRLRSLPPGAHVAERWDEDRDQFSRYHDYVSTGGYPQPKRDSAVGATIRLNALERDQAAYDAQRAFDDPLAMAEYRLTGEAFAGTVTAADPERRTGAGRGKVLRPVITVRTTDRLRLAAGDTNLCDRARPKQKAEILSVTAGPDGTDVELQLAGGMGRGRVPPPGTVPAVGEQVCYSTLTDDYQPRGVFPEREATPWTHGGPDAPSLPGDEDATEDWS